MAEDRVRAKIKTSLENNDLSGISALSENPAAALKYLVRFSLDKDTLAGWRAIKAVGLIARELVATDLMVLRETSRKLLWSLSDESGGIGWSAPELLGEIVSANPRLFSDLIPVIVSVYDIEEDVFRPGVLYALARIAETAPDLVLKQSRVILQGLSDANPLSRIFALKALQPIAPLLESSRRDEAMSAVRSMLQDREEAWVYEDTGFIARQPGTDAQKVYEFLNSLA